VYIKQTLNRNERCCRYLHLVFEDQEGGTKASFISLFKVLEMHLTDVFRSIPISEFAASIARPIDSSVALTFRKVI
jgi:hypothetical protein